MFCKNRAPAQLEYFLFLHIFSFRDLCFSPVVKLFVNVLNVLYIESISPVLGGNKNVLYNDTESGKVTERIVTH